MPFRQLASRRAISSLSRERAPSTRRLKPSIPAVSWTFFLRRSSSSILHADPALLADSAAGRVTLGRGDQNKTFVVACLLEQSFKNGSLSVSCLRSHYSPNFEDGKTLPGPHDCDRHRAPGGRRGFSRGRPVPAPVPCEILVKSWRRAQPPACAAPGQYPRPGRDRYPRPRIARGGALGSGGKRLKPGDKICALVSAAAMLYAAYERTRWRAGRAFGGGGVWRCYSGEFLSVWLTLFMRADFKPGDWVLVHAALRRHDRDLLARHRRKASPPRARRRIVRPRQARADVAVELQDVGFRWGAGATKEATGGAGAN